MLPAPTIARVDLAALVHNARLLAAHAAPACLMAVVKANAYGHGAAACARALESDGVEAFAVATTAEALALREAGVRGRILVFGAPFEADLAAATAHALEVNACSLGAVERIVHSGAALRVHVKVDTGMHRLGLAPEEVPEALRRLREAPRVEVVGLWSHLATSDAHADAQARRMETFQGLAPDVPRHLQNSGGVLYGAGRLDAATLVRTGIALYGADPEGDEAHAASAGLRPVLSLLSRVAQVRTIRAGEAVSYGRTWTAPRETRLATVACGYADGLPRLLSNRGAMTIAGRRYEIAGRVCMDMTMLDLGAPDDPGADVREGDEVVVFGAGGISVEQVARWAETIAYEVLTGVGARVPRVYEGG
ncbi:MAG TPA: alanine racemase [Rhodothermales bacterium]|nr:alanine racemase [Rhodothermales bacterium]